MESREKRTENRIRVSETGFLISQDGSKRLMPVKISNISFNGVGFAADQSVSVNETYMLKYSLLHRSFDFLVKIKWAQAENKVIHAGCKKSS